MDIYSYELEQVIVSEPPLSMHVHLSISIWTILAHFYQSNDQFKNRFIHCNKECLHISKTRHVCTGHISSVLSVIYKSTYIIVEYISSSDSLHSFIAAIIIKISAEQDHSASRNTLI